MSARTALADIAELIAAMPTLDAGARAAALARVEARGAGLGRLAETAGWLAGVRGGETRVLRPIVALYISTHSAEPGDPATAAAQARLEHLAAGGGAVSVLAQAQGAGVEVFDLALNRPSPDPALRPAMSERECAATIAFGMEALAKSPDLLILGDATGQSDRAASALAWALHGGAAADWSASPAWAEHAVERGRAAGATTPLEWLCQLGGRETAAVFGALAAAGTQRVPVLLDGYPGLAAAAVMQALRPGALAHVRLGAPPAATGAVRLAQRLGLEPLANLGIATGEGVGACTALPLVKLAGELAAR